MLIGIAGQARNGKDTIAHMIKSNIPNLTHISFADALKETVEMLFNLNRSELEKYKCCVTENCPGMDVPMRVALQTIGECLRTVKSTYWIDRMRVPENAIISDIRYENELDWIIAKQGIIILVARQVTKSNVPSESFLIPAIEWFLKHTSKPIVNIKEITTPFSQFDYFVRNDSNLEDLENSINQLSFVTVC